MEQKSMENSAQGPQTDTSSSNFLNLLRNQFFKGLLGLLFYANCCCLSLNYHYVTESMAAIQEPTLKVKVLLHSILTISVVSETIVTFFKLLIISQVKINFQP